MLPVLLALLGACSSADPAPSFDRVEPREGLAHSNVLVVLLDDVGTDKIGVYGEHPHPARTPTLDSLAEQGTRFTRAYAYSTCSPTRAALLTGRHSRRSGVGYNIRARADEGMSPEAVTLPEMLAAGARPYASGGVGKWHLEPRRSQSIRHPKAQGFQVFSGALGNLPKPETYDHYTWYADDGSVTEETDTYLTTREVDEAIRLVGTLPEPWFVYVALHAPHYPWTPPPAHLVQTVPPPDAGDVALYDATLEAADTELARLLEAVDLEQTVVMVLGDNGDPDEVVVPPSSPEAAKNTMFEGGIRVPWFVLGRGVPRGRVVDELVHVVDIFPTLAELAGVAAPGVDGVSLWPVLLDEPHPRRPFAFTEKYFPHRREPSWMAVRDERFKLIVSNRGFQGLYDLQGRHDDGPNLLEAGPLAPEARQAHERLKGELARMDEDLTGDAPKRGCGGP